MPGQTLHKTKQPSRTYKGNKKDQELTRSLCRKWALNPLKNPLTKRTITKDGKPYKTLEKECAKLMSVQSHKTRNQNNQNNNAKVDTNNANSENMDTNGTVVIPPPEPASASEKQQIQACTIRKCDTFILRDLTVKFVSPKRQFIMQTATSCTASSQLHKIYDKFNLCEAPLTFDTSHETMLKNIENNVRLYSMMASHLHLMYGSCIIPGYWHVNDKANDFEVWSSKPLFNLAKPTNLTNLKDIMQYVNSSDDFFHIMPIVAWTDDEMCNDGSCTLGGCHAMTIVIYKPPASCSKGSKPLVCVLDTYLDRENKYIDKVSDVLRMHEKDLMYNTVAPYVQVFKRNKKMFQAANNSGNRSHLDASGFCGVWAMFIIEIMARNYVQRKTDNMIACELLDFGINLDLPSEPGELWRKLIIDYFYSRIIDMYAIAHVIRNKKVKNFLFNNVIENYVHDVFIGRIMRNIINYIPDFETSAMERLQMHKY